MTDKTPRQIAFAIYEALRAQAKGLGQELGFLFWDTGILTVEDFIRKLMAVPKFSHEDEASIAAFIADLRDDNFQAVGLGSTARNARLDNALERLLRKQAKMEKALKECVGTIKVLYRDSKSTDIIRTCNEIMDRANLARGVLISETGVCPKCSNPCVDENHCGTTMCDVCCTEYMIHERRETIGAGGGISDAGGH